MSFPNPDPFDSGRLTRANSVDEGYTLASQPARGSFGNMTTSMANLSSGLNLGKEYGGYPQRQDSVVAPEEMGSDNPARLQEQRSEFVSAGDVPQRLPHNVVPKNLIQG
jgi:hypothetical protein